jgi:LmbE family N-acetylglucosaminyl deacetylase
VTAEPDPTGGSRFEPSGLPGDLPWSGPITVDLPVPARALAIGAHPDDIEFGCGATLAKWAARGCEIRHLVLTDGSKGSWDPGADLAELVAERQEECRVAASVIDGRSGGSGGSGASVPAVTPEQRVVFLGKVDGELCNGVNERRAVARVIRSVQPNVVLCHDPWRRYRLHPDHRAAGFLSLDSVVSARDPHFFPELGMAAHRLDALLLFEPDQPNHVEDARDFTVAKVDALLCHRTQWLSTLGIGAPHDTAPANPSQRTALHAKVGRQLAEHGSLAGLSDGEAFHLLTVV